jgi:hypothetical protein
LNVSSTQYGNVLTTYAVPTTEVPPAGATWSQLTGTARSPKIYFGKGLGKIVGFNEPSDTDFTTSHGETTDTLLNTVSNLVPETNAFNTIIFTAPGFVYNQGGLSSPPTYLFSTGLSAAFNSLVSTSEAQDTVWNSIVPGNHRDIEIRAFDIILKRLEFKNDSVQFTLTMIKQ